MCWPARILGQHNAARTCNALQSALLVRGCAGWAQPRARDFAWILPSVPDGSECEPLFEVFGSHWVRCGEQFSVQLAHRHNPSIPSKGFAHAPGAFHLHRDEAAPPLEWPLLRALDARMYDRRNCYKGRHEHKRAGSRHRKTMDHVRQPGSTDPLLAVAPLGSHWAPLECFWRACKGRRLSGRRLACSRWPVSQKPRFSREAAQRLSAQSRFGSRTSGLNHYHIPPPTRQCRCERPPTAHLHALFLQNVAPFPLRCARHAIYCRSAAHLVCRETA